jgi:hypothetical protein
MRRGRNEVLLVASRCAPLNDLRLRIPSPESRAPRSRDRLETGPASDGTAARADGAPREDRAAWPRPLA